MNRMNGLVSGCVLAIVASGCSALTTWPDVNDSTAKNSGGAGGTAGKTSVGGTATQGGAGNPGGTSSGATSVGGATAGGVANVAGTSSSNGGGANVAGTSSGFGGADAQGGSAPVTGGTTSTTAGGQAGATVGSGGPTAGAMALGGASPVGGTTSIGGSAASGNPGTAGATTGGVGLGTGGAATGGSTTGGVATGVGGVATGGTATGGAAPSTGGAATGGCPGTGGPTMVKLPQGYCIDSTEVTRDQYAAWQNTTTADTINAQDATNCSWNTTFVPDATCMLGTAGDNVCQGAACGNHPQVCVDWCDAYAYCAGVGKRLCGTIGGGASTYADYLNASLSQWYNACTSGGANTYPYGSTYSGTACNGDSTSITTTPVGSFPGCQAPVPYAGVYDLSGNVTEWEDSCNSAGQLATCRIRGGAYRGSYPSYLTCGDANGGGRAGSWQSIGLRCCSL